jgi:hypothetical protein
MTRPCRWPDGGCGAQVEFFPTGNFKPDGSPRMQVVDANPERRIIRIEASTGVPLEGEATSQAATRTALTWKDHHATCPKWAAKVERERAARAARP